MKLFLIFTCLWFLFESSLQAQNQRAYFGMQTHFGQLDRNDIDSATVLAILDSLQKAGVQTIRDEMYWSFIETVPGIFSFPPQFDFYVEQAHLRNISVLLILNYNNPLYAAHAGYGVTTDTNRALFARYCSSVVSRYSPKGVKKYEIWNEPNIPQFWDPTPNAADYAKLLKKVYPVLKQLDSSVTIIAGATSPAEGNPSPYIEWKTYFTQLMQQGVQQYCDGYSFHLYRVDKQPELFLDNDINSLLTITNNTKKLYLTECGYHTSTAWPALSEQKQAEYVSRLFLLGKKFSSLELISYYDFRNDGLTASQPEHNYGILYHNLSPKPAYPYFMNMVTELKDKQYQSQVVQSGFYRYTFSGNTEKTHAFWTTASATAKTESFGSNYLRIKHSDGRWYYQYTKSKILSVPYSSSPLFYTELATPPALTGLNFLPAPESLIVNQSVQLQAQGSTGDGAPLYIDNTGGVWTVSDSTALISASGLLTAKKTGLCTVTYQFNNLTCEKQFIVLPSYTTLELPAFEPANYQMQMQNLLPESQVTPVDSNYRTAPAALLVKYALRYAGIDKHKVIFDFTSLPLLGEPDSLLLDVYNNGNGHIFTFTFSDADGQEFSINTSFSALGNTIGWKTVKVSMMNFGSAFTYPVKLKRLTLFCVKSGGVIDSIYRGAILLDNLRIHNGITTSVQKETHDQPESIRLLPAYPNPFNPETVINFYLPELTKVKLSVYTISGEEIATLLDAELPRGLHKTVFNAKNFATGIYVCRLQTSSQIIHQKLMLVR